MLDQQVAPITLRRPRPNQSADFSERRIVGLAAFELTFSLDARSQFVNRGNRHCLDVMELASFGRMIHDDLTL